MCKIGRMIILNHLLINKLYGRMNENNKKLKC